MDAWVPSKLLYQDETSGKVSEPMWFFGFFQHKSLCDLGGFQCRNANNKTAALFGSLRNENAIEFIRVDLSSHCNGKQRGEIFWGSNELVKSECRPLWLGEY